MSIKYESDKKIDGLNINKVNNLDRKIQNLENKIRTYEFGFKIVAAIFTFVSLLVTYIAVDYKNDIKREFEILTDKYNREIEIINEKIK